MQKYKCIAANTGINGEPFYAIQHRDVVEATSLLWSFELYLEFPYFIIACPNPQKVSEKILKPPISQKIKKLFDQVILCSHFFVLFFFAGKINTIEKKTY